jgi:hypothetical protein
MLYFNVMHEVAHIDQRGVLELLLWEVGATLVVALIEFHQTFIDAQTAIIMEKAHHLLDSYSLVSGMGRYFIKKYVMNVDQQLTFEFELLAILEVLVFELFLLVSFGGPADFGVVVFGIVRLLVFLFGDINLHDSLIYQI